jgi:hypothetical protein
MTDEAVIAAKQWFENAQREARRNGTPMGPDLAGWGWAPHSRKLESGRELVTAYSPEAAFEALANMEGGDDEKTVLSPALTLEMEHTPDGWRCCGQPDA